MSGLFDVFVAAYRAMVALWNACIVLQQVLQSIMQEAKQEAAEVMAFLDDDAPMMDAITTASLLLDAVASAPSTRNAWQTLIIARASSFILLFRISKHRVLHLEVDESFIVAKLEVIRTDLKLHIQHVPRFLQMPIGTHDTRLIRYTPMSLPYVWKEEQASASCGSELVERSVVPAPSLNSVRAGPEGSSRRKKCVQLLKESALRRRLHMDQIGGTGSEAASKRGTSVASVRRKALANATNKGLHAEGSADADQAFGETRGADTPNVAETPKQARMERNPHAALSENLSMPNMALRKAAENVQQPHSMGSQSLRRRRGHLGLYSQGASSEFSLVPKIDQGRD